MKQWFGNDVTCPECGVVWLSDSWRVVCFACYSAKKQTEPCFSERWQNGWIFEEEAAGVVEVARPAEPPPAVKPTVPPPYRLNLLKIRHNLSMSGNDKGNKLRILDDAIAVASGVDLDWLLDMKRVIEVEEVARPAEPPSAATAWPAAWPPPLPQFAAQPELPAKPLIRTTPGVKVNKKRLVQGSVACCACAYAFSIRYRLDHDAAPGFHTTAHECPRCRNFTDVTVRVGHLRLVR